MAVAIAVALSVAVAVTLAKSLALALALAVGFICLSTLKYLVVSCRQDSQLIFFRYH